MRYGFWGSLAFGAALCLAACGGGGSSGGGSGGSGGDSQPQSEAPTYQMKPSVQPAAQQMTAMVLNEGNLLIRLAQFTTDVAQRFVAAGGSQSVTANCADTGTVTLNFEDRDASGGASSGDSVLVTLQDCGVPNLRRTVTGAVRIDIISGAGEALVAAGQARLTVVNQLELIVKGGIALYDFAPTSFLTGSVNVQWTLDSTGETLRTQSSASDDLRIAMTRYGNAVTDRLRKIDVSRGIRYDLGRVTSSMKFMQDLGSSGSIAVTTSVPLSPGLNALPPTGALEILASDYSVEAETQLFSGPGLGFYLTQTQRSSGLKKLLGNNMWSGDYAMLSDAFGYGPQLNRPWRGLRPGSTAADQLTMRPVPGVIANTRGDALFQKPVAPAPSATSSGATFRLQFPVPLANETPQLYFRFRDVGGSIYPELPNWNIAATAVRNGAYFDIRPVESLRHDRTYNLEISVDGVYWANDPSTTGALKDIVIKGEDGTQLYSGNGFFGDFRTDDALKLEIPTLNTWRLTAVLPGVPVQLRPKASAKAGRNIVKYRWEQLSGAPVDFSSMDTLEADVSFSAAVRTIDKVTLQLTVTDDAGEVERLRVVLMMGNTAPSYLRYSETLFPNEPFYNSTGLATGLGAIAFDPGLNEYRFGDINSSLGYAIYPLSLRMPNGESLRVGVFEDVDILPGSRSKAAMSNTAGCTDGQPPKSRFEIIALDAVFSPTFYVRSFAVNYEQRCGPPRGEVVRGQFRYSSPVLIQSWP